MQATANCNEKMDGGGRREGTAGMRKGHFFRVVSLAEFGGEKRERKKEKLFSMAKKLSLQIK
jgi:hypothetical protein